VDPRFEPDQLGAPLEHEVLTEAVAPIHLERDPAEIAKPFLTQAKEGAALTAQIAGSGGGTAAGRRRGHGNDRAGACAVAGLLVRGRALPQQTWEQR
jgi:hypothetical protein